MCWYFDHYQGRSVHGSNLLNALYYSANMAVPVDFEVVRKPLQFCDLKMRKNKTRH